VTRPNQRRFIESKTVQDFGRAEGMIADPRFDAGRFRAPANDAVSVLLEEGVGCKLAMG
jgi:hypothetical protein